tara:strand:+ start:248 stop:904 length:657 start_codon:yes stop_codon:yes gene_type:complete
LKEDRPLYLELKDHYEAKLFLHGDNHRGVDWPNKLDAETRYRVMMGVLDFLGREGNNAPKVLDLGCGLSHQYDYFLRNGLDVDYTGVDISREFVERSKAKYPNNSYVVADILRDEKRIPLSDYVLANGLFTEKLSMTFDEMWHWVGNMLVAMSKKAKIGFACNFMSTNVEWQRDDLFHLSVDQLIEFVSSRISKEIIVRSDYGLYEYTIYVGSSPKQV